MRAEVDNPGEALKPEMFASFSIITGGDRTAPAVPQSAVVYEGDTARVWVARPDHSRGAARHPHRAGSTATAWSRCWPGSSPASRSSPRGTLFIDRAAQGD